jgi:hypothetical protein
MRDVLNSGERAYSNVLTCAKAGPMDFRYSRNEIKFVPMLDIVAFQQKIESLAARRQALDLALQEANWQNDLLERPERIVL